MKYPGALLLLLCSIPLHAEITQPDCPQLQAWATQFDRDDQWQVTPRYPFPGITRDEVLVPVFGDPITRWSMKDFQDFHQWMRNCRRELRQEDPVADRTLAAASAAMMRLAGYVRQFDRTRGEAEQAVGALLDAPESEGRAAAIELAQQALRGTNIRRELRNVPRELMRPLMGLTNVHGMLPQQDLDALQAQLSAAAGSAAASADSSTEAKAASKSQDGQDRTPASRSGRSPDRQGAQPQVDTSESSAGADSQLAVSRAFEVPDISNIELPPPPLQGDSDVTRMRLVGVRLGMPLEAAIEAAQRAGFRLKGRDGGLHNLGVFKYWLDSAQLERGGEIEPFPGRMSKAEAQAYKTRIAVQSVQSGGVSLVAYEGRVGSIAVSASTFDSPASVREYIHEQLGKPHKESETAGPSWHMKWFHDADGQAYSDAQVRVTVKPSRYTDHIRGETVPYTQIRYSAWLCTTLPKCME